MSKLTETIIVKREITGVIADLVHFVRYLENRATPTSQLTDDKLIELASDFWETQHGED